MKKAVIVDFDGTFVSINSFEYFYKELTKCAIKTGNIALFAFLLYQITLRKLRLIEHCELKKRTLHYFFNSNLLSFIPDFVGKLRHYVNDSVFSLCRDYKSNGYAVHLCTAAPELYVKPFVDSFDVKFDDVYSKSSLITPPTGGVGPMTICMLCYNSAYSIYGDEVWAVLDNGIEKAKVLVKEK